MSSPGLGLGLRPGFPLILGALSSGFAAASLPSLLHLRTFLLEQLATSSAGDGSAPGQKQSAVGLYGLFWRFKLDALHDFLMTEAIKADRRPQKGVKRKTCRAVVGHLRTLWLDWVLTLNTPDTLWSREHTHTALNLFTDSLNWDSG